VQPDPESQRLDEDARRVRNWKRWGPYLAERQWGTVREDYSANGTSWDYLPHDHARSRAYRWGEDGLLGITDRECRLCFALALWNGRDPILKERLFGLSGPEGNHGEDVKELYYYLDSAPTHSYMHALYRYPQAAYPYARLVRESRARTQADPEFELLDTGVFDGARYFDVAVEYAKISPDDMLIRITAANRGPETATLDLLPTLWFRNTWSWGRRGEGFPGKPRIVRDEAATVIAEHETLGRACLSVIGDPNGPTHRWLMTENETNGSRLFGLPNRSPLVKDAFHDHVILGSVPEVAAAPEGTKAAAWFRCVIPPGAETVLRLRLSPLDAAGDGMDVASFDEVIAARVRETDDFYASRLPGLSAAEHDVARQAFAGLLWTKQFYHYVVEQWLAGDPTQPAPPPGRDHGRNHDWRHLYNRDVISMPDKWEYPWYAAWDLAFHTITLARVDPEFAKAQIMLFLREWYMHPNGQIPAYEWALSDVNPPVHAWAAWRIYKMTGERGQRDTLFLERVFQKLLINFTWWVNRKDLEGNNIFAGGFLGLDNIGVFDRSQPLPTGGYLEQADGTAWMAFYCGTMLSIALELAQHNPAYEDLASKFFEHYLAIADAMNELGGTGLWDEADGFYYDQIHVDGSHVPLRLRSLVGVIPLIAVEVLEQDTIDRLPGFKKRLNWFLENRTDLAKNIARMTSDSDGSERRLLAIPSLERLLRVLEYVLDEKEFLSPHGLRSLSAIYRDAPYEFRFSDRVYRVQYAPAEGRSGLFGGNSNWRGPVWFPINFLLIEALERYHHFYGDTLLVECPKGSGNTMNLREVAHELAARMVRLFMADEAGRRPCHGAESRYATDPHWKDLVLFYEYFDGDNGRGAGASHQTGWTALVVRCIEIAAERSTRVRA
jgi:Mannosylglycerate hydrolase MGH1-like glycoside hydrolase domain